MSSNDDIVFVPIPGLMRGADQNNSDETKGLIMFVRGNVDVDNETFTQDEQDDDDEDKQRFSKEARIAKLYRLVQTTHLLPIHRKTKKMVGSQ